MDDVLTDSDALGPAKIVHVREPGLGLEAVLVVDNVACGPSIGGLRMASDVSTAECLRLARAMTLKNAAAGRHPTPRGRFMIRTASPLPISLGSRRRASRCARTRAARHSIATPCSTRNATSGFPLRTCPGAPGRRSARSPPRGRCSSSLTAEREAEIAWSSEPCAGGI